MTSAEQFHAVSVQILHDKAAQLRIDIVLATTEAGSGHPNSCASAAEIVSLLFFAIMRYDPRNPRRLSKTITSTEAWETRFSWRCPASCFADTS